MPYLYTLGSLQSSGVRGMRFCLIVVSYTTTKNSLFATKLCNLQLRRTSVYATVQTPTTPGLQPTLSDILKKTPIKNFGAL